MSKTPTPRPGQDRHGVQPRVLGSLGDGAGFLVDRRSDAKERVVPRGQGLGPAPTKRPAPPNPGSDPRGEKKYFPVKRDPPKPDSAAAPVRVVGATKKAR
jgi:hypothetical protein